MIVGALPDVHFSSDPRDNPILATAIVGKAEMIVSGDKKHLLARRGVAGSPIVTARDALASLAQRRPTLMLAATSRKPPPRA